MGQFISDKVSDTISLLDSVIAEPRLYRGDTAYNSMRSVSNAVKADAFARCMVCT
jgi:hypothetical protein